MRLNAHIHGWSSCPSGLSDPLVPLGLRSLVPGQGTANNTLASAKVAPAPGELANEMVKGCCSSEQMFTGSFFQPRNC